MLLYGCCLKWHVTGVAMAGSGRSRALVLDCFIYESVHEEVWL